MANSDRCRRCGAIADTRPVSVKGQAPLDLCHRCFDATVAAHGLKNVDVILPPEPPTGERPLSRSKQRRRRAQAAEEPAQEPETETPEGTGEGDETEPSTPVGEGA